MRFSVDREGRILRAESTALLPRDFEDRVVAVVAETGFIAAELSGPAPAVSRWFGLESVDDLSLEEASILAERWVGDLEQDRVVAEPRRLIEPLRSALLQAFRAAAQTGIVRTPHIDEAALLRVVAASDADRVHQWLEQRLTGLQRDLPE